MLDTIHRHPPPPVECTEHGLQSLLKDLGHARIHMSGSLFEHELEGPGFIEGMISWLPYVLQRSLRDKGIFHPGRQMHRTPNAYVQPALPSPASKTSVGTCTKAVSSVPTDVMATEAPPTKMQFSNTYRPMNTGMQSRYQRPSPCLICGSLEHCLRTCPQCFELDCSASIEWL